MIHAVPSALYFLMLFLPSPQTVTDWILQLADPDPSKRIAACEALWKTGAPAAEALTALEDLAQNDPSEGVKWMASRAAGQIRAALSGAREDEIPASPAAGAPQPKPPTIAQVSAETTAEQSARLGLLIGSHDGQGIRIVGVAAKSPAGRAGLESGDIILEMGDTKFYDAKTSRADFASFTRSLLPGVSVRLLVQRGRHRFETSITPEKPEMGTEKAALAKAAYDEGRRRMEARDYAGAAALFEKAISQVPFAPSYYAALAESFFRRQDSNGEIDALKRGVAAAPSYSLYSLLGIACRAGGRFDEAIDAFDKAIAVMPPDVKDIEVYQQFGFCRMKKRQYREALALFETAYSINPRSPAAVYFLGGCHDVLDNRDQAMRFYRDYLALRHSNNDWNKYAERRLRALQGKERSGPSTADQLIGIVDTIVRDVARVNAPAPAEVFNSQGGIAAPHRSPDAAGTQWEQQELGFTATWTRQGKSNEWIASWARGCTRSLITMEVNGNKIKAIRQDQCAYSNGLSATYEGTILPDGTVTGKRTITHAGSGTSQPRDLVGKEQPWSAKIIN